MKAKLLTVVVGIMLVLGCSKSAKENQNVRSFGVEYRLSYTNDKDFIFNFSANGIKGSMEDGEYVYFASEDHRSKMLVYSNEDIESGQKETVSIKSVENVLMSSISFSGLSNNLGKSYEVELQVYIDGKMKYAEKINVPLGQTTVILNYNFGYDGKQ